MIFGIVDKTVGCSYVTVVGVVVGFVGFVIVLFPMVFS